MKANSIEGVKRKDVLVNYTPATNLLKTDEMEVVPMNLITQQCAL